MAKNIKEAMMKSMHKRMKPSSDDYKLKVKKVDSDDYGDKQWKYYSELRKGKKKVWNDYHRTKPTKEEVKKSIED